MTSNELGNLAGEERWFDVMALASRMSIRRVGCSPRQRHRLGRMAPGIPASLGRSALWCARNAGVVVV
jgi:hypothetical protein